MERGYINITEKDNGFTVKAKLVNGTLWLSQWQIATLFNVYTKKIECNLKSIFKAGLLNETDVTRLHTFVHEGRKSEQVLYNLEAIIFLGFRIGSLETKAFREWVLKGVSEYLKRGKENSPNVLIVLNSHASTPIITSLN